MYFNQVNLQRACCYQAVVVSGCSGAVRLSLRSLLQWWTVTACTCFVQVFCSNLLVFSTPALPPSYLFSLLIFLFSILFIYLFFSLH